MRDILFRGKRLDNGEWVYGFYCHVPRGRLDRDEHMIQNVKKSGKMGMLHCVDPSTVGLYTGLKEGDEMLKYQKGYIFNGHTFVVNKEDVHNATDDMFVEATAFLPVSDVVPVVRCRECKHLDVVNRKELYAHCPKTNTVFLPFELDTREHFCSLGERKEGTEK